MCRVCRLDCAALAARLKAVKDAAVMRSIILATEPRFGQPEHAKMLDAVVKGDKKCVPAPPPHTSCLIR